MLGVMNFCMGVNGRDEGCGVSGTDGELGVGLKVSLFSARAAEQCAKDGSSTSDRPDREGATEVSLEDWPLL